MHTSRVLIFGATFLLATLTPIFGFSQDQCAAADDISQKAAVLQKGRPVVVDLRWNLIVALKPERGEIGNSWSMTSRLYGMFNGLGCEQITSKVDGIPTVQEPTLISFLILDIDKKRFEGDFGKGAKVVGPNSHYLFFRIEEVTENKKHILRLYLYVATIRDVSAVDQDRPRP